MYDVALEAEHKGRFTYQQIYDYLKNRKYPEGLEKSHKLALQKRDASVVHWRYILSPACLSLDQERRPRLVIED